MLLINKINMIDPDAIVSDYDRPMVMDTGGTMVVIQANGNVIAEYRYSLTDNTTQLRAKARIQLRRSIRRHFAAGGTIGNYNW
jgi:hypothetical protein